MTAPWGAARATRWAMRRRCSCRAPASRNCARASAPWRGTPAARRPTAPRWSASPPRSPTPTRPGWTKWWAAWPPPLPALARDLGKEAPEVVLQSGVPVAVKPQAADALRNAFMHLLRNALDHGIEPAAERAARGKPAAGRIRIGAALDAQELEIRLADDGRGLDLDRIQAQARARGLIAEDATPAPGDVAHLIFAPGFSTAGEVTAVSGRGVGMDAVKAFVESLGGRIQLVLAGGARARPRRSKPCCACPPAGRWWPDVGGGAT